MLAPQNQAKSRPRFLTGPASLELLPRSRASTRVGQASIELLVLMGVVLLVLLAFLFVYMDWNTLGDSLVAKAQASRAASNLARAINLVSQAGDGANYSYENTAGDAVNLTITGHAVLGAYAGHGSASGLDYVSAALASNLTNITVPGNGIANSTTLRLRNSNGTVIIEPG